MLDKKLGKLSGIRHKTVKILQMGKRLLLKFIYLKAGSSGREDGRGREKLGLKLHKIKDL